MGCGWFFAEVARVTHPREGSDCGCLSGWVCFFLACEGVLRGLFTYCTMTALLGGEGCLMNLASLYFIHFTPQPPGFFLAVAGQSRRRDDLGWLWGTL